MIEGAIIIKKLCNNSCDREYSPNTINTIWINTDDGPLHTHNVPPGKYVPSLEYRETGFGLGSTCTGNVIFSEIVEIK